MHRLRNPVMHYDWGSRTAIAELLGRPSPQAEPEAEIWMWSHASAPSMLRDAGQDRSLADWIAESPDARLGWAARERHGDGLPFLLKVLAAERPLSLQVHPTLEQARAGFAREDALGIPRSARDRNYKDSNHKPELLCALGVFDALCGFRPAGETIALLEHLGVHSLEPFLDAIRRDPGPDGLKAAFRACMTLPRQDAARLVRELAEACRAALSRDVSENRWRAQLEWTLVLAGSYPADVGVVASLLMRHVRLELGEAMYLPPGTLHTYLGGIGIELMACSDNVLRGGLTTKVVDVAELLETVDFCDRPFEPVLLHRVCEHESAYGTPAADFRLSVVTLEAGRSCTPRRRGPELLLCTSGTLHARTGAGEVFELRSGESVFVAADDGTYSLSGPACAYRATVGDG